MNKNCEEFQKEIQEFQEIWDEFEKNYKDKVNAQKVWELLDEIRKRKDEIFDKYERLIMRISSFETFKYLSKKEGIDIENFDFFETNNAGMIVGTFLENDSEKIFVFDKDDNFRVIDEIGGEEIQRIQTLRLKENNEILGIRFDELFSLDLKNNKEDTKKFGSSMHDFCTAKDGTIAISFSEGLAHEIDKIYIKNEDKNLEKIIEIPQKYKEGLPGRNLPVFESINYDENNNVFRGIINEIDRKSCAYSIDLDNLALNVEENIKFPKKTYSPGVEKFVGMHSNPNKQVRNTEYFYLNDKGEREETVIAFDEKLGTSTNFFNFQKEGQFAITYNEVAFIEYYDEYGDPELIPTNFEEDKSIIFFAKNDGELEKIDKIEGQKIKAVEELRLNGDGALFGIVEMEDDKTYKFMFDGRKYRAYPLK